MDKHIRVMENGVQLPDLAKLLPHLNFNQEHVVLAAITLPGDPSNTFVVIQEHAPARPLERPYHVLCVDARTGNVGMGAEHATLGEALGIFKTQVQVVAMLSTMPEHMR